jgi:uncharacterized protein YkwD
MNYKPVFIIILILVIVSGDILAAIYPNKYSKNTKLNSCDISQIQAQEMRMIELTNYERAKFKLPPLKLLNTLQGLAKQHSVAMASQAVKFGHDGFENRANAIKKHGQHCSFGENVAYNYLVKDPLQNAMDGWMKSKGHRDNILGDFDEIGVGIAYSKEGRCYLTQLFAKRITNVKGARTSNKQH